jgi:phosphatidylserine/phosphatidylglycerophosphate/cardiolipin synthase-like enzyme
MWQASKPSHVMTSASARAVLSAWAFSLRREVIAKQPQETSYMVTDTAVIEALRKAATRGVKVRVWRDSGMAEKVGALDLEAELGGPVRGIEIRSNALGGELMHLKGYCLDGQLLRTGSANFSRSGETRQDNDLVALRGPSVCAGFEAKFDRAWGKG